jgi:hypothetical protein
MIRAQKLGAALFAAAAVAAVAGAARFGGSATARVKWEPPLQAIHTYSSSNTLALGEAGGRLYAFVADEDRPGVRVFDTAKNEELPELDLDAPPGHVIVEHGSVFVSVPSKNEVREIGFPDRTLKRVYSTCDEPIALATDIPHDRVFVLCAWGHALQGFNHTTGAKVVDVELPREPRGMVRLGDTIGIAHAVGSKVSFVSVAEGTSSALDLGGRRGRFADGAHVQSFGTLGCGAQLVSHAMNQGYALAAVSTEHGTRWMVPLVDVVPMPAEASASAAPRSRPAVEFSGYGVSVNASCPSDPPTSGRLVTLDPSGSLHSREELALGCLLPRAIAADPHSGAIAIACLGDDAVHLKEGRGRRVLRVPAGPTGIAYDDRGRLFTWSEFDHALSVTDPEGEPREVAASTRKARPPTSVEVGRAIFHATDNRGVSSDGRACASCHPSGREDGLVWGAPDGPRQTPMLAGRLGSTAPYGWNGTRDTVAGHMAQTIKRLGGTGLAPHEADAVIAYITTLDPPKSHPPKPHEAPLVDRGRDLFDSTGCSGCHIAESAFTDGFSHDFEASRAPKRGPKRAKGASIQEKIATFDTPSLRFVGGTAPYFHDGRYASLRELLSDKKSSMADLSKLAPADERALEAYLGTL